MRSCNKRLALFAASAMAALCGSCLSVQREAVEWNIAESHHQIPSYKRYLALFPSGEHAPIARERIEAITAYAVEIKQWVRQNGIELRPEEAEVARKGLFLLVNPVHAAANFSTTWRGEAIIRSKKEMVKIIGSGIHSFPGVDLMFADQVSLESGSGTNVYRALHYFDGRVFHCAVQ
jgi:hypothetical protein